MYEYVSCRSARPQYLRGSNDPCVIRNYQTTREKFAREKQRLRRSWKIIHQNNALQHNTTNQNITLQRCYIQKRGKILSMCVWVFCVCVCDCECVLVCASVWGGWEEGRGGRVGHGICACACCIYPDLNSLLYLFPGNICRAHRICCYWHTHTNLAESYLPRKLCAKSILVSSSASMRLFCVCVCCNFQFKSIRRYDWHLYTLCLYVNIYGGKI